MSLQAVLQERISSAQVLLQRAELLVSGVSGQQKLCGKLRAELRFLRRVEAGELQVRESHLHSTNLTHLTAIVESAASLQDVVALLHVFTYRDAAGQRQTLVVDVVADGGHTWVKAVGRKAEALHNIWQGRGQYGDKSIISQAGDFLRASRQQEVHYRPPRVVFAFYNGVSCPMARRLKGMDVGVRGDIVAVNSVTLEEGEEPEEDDEEGEEPAADNEEPAVDNEEGEEPSVDNEEGEEPAVDNEEGEEPSVANEEGEEPAEEGEEPSVANEQGEEPAEEEQQEELTRVDRSTVLARLAFPLQVKVEACRRVNLDITTLITYVSALSHGRCRLSFREPVLTEQAAQERREPVLPPLDDFLRGKQLFACRAAVSDFQLILDTLGGPGEKRRAAALLARLQQVDDQPSPRSLSLAPSAKVNRRSLLIFGTGDSLRAVTMTANSRFVRAAANQGVRYSVFIHQPRALTEGKEWRATAV